MSTTAGKPPEKRRRAILQVTVACDPTYPSKPKQRPLLEVLEDAIGDAFRNKDGIEPITPSSLKVQISIVDEIEIDGPTLETALRLHLEDQ